MSRRRVASYGPSPDNPHCKTCGERVCPEIARVLGDNDGNVPECRKCSGGSSTTWAILSSKGLGSREL